MNLERVSMARPAARAALRGAVSALRARRGRTDTGATRRSSTSDGRTMLLLPVTRRGAAPHGLDARVFVCDGRRRGELWTHADPGTGTYEIVARLDRDADHGADRDAGHGADHGGDQVALAAALRLVFEEVHAASPGFRVAVRRSLDPLARGPEPAVLTGLGLTHVATFPGEHAAPQAWAGEERWELPG